MRDVDKFKLMLSVLNRKYGENSCPFSNKFYKEFGCSGCLSKIKSRCGKGSLNNELIALAEKEYRRLSYKVINEIEELLDV